MTMAKDGIFGSDTRRRGPGRPPISQDVRNPIRRMAGPIRSGAHLARMFHELASRDREHGCATGLPQGVGSEAYLNSTSQGPTPEDARKDGHIRGRSRRFMKYPGWKFTENY